METDRFPVLIADIGGTNARFRVLETAESEPWVVDTVAVARFGSIEEAVVQCVMEPEGPTPVRAIIAAAGPIRADGMDFTNSPWEVRPDRFLAETGIGELQLVNDFEAQALALPYLDDDDVTLVDCGEHVTPRADRTKVVLGPGTGLGVGQLVHVNDSWAPVAGEGGHVDLGPRSDEEAAVWTHLERIGGRVSAEQVLSGSGLLNLYKAVCKADDAEILFHEPGHVTTSALEARERGEENHATRTLTLFATCLGRVAGDLALTAYARGGVYLAGGIPQKIEPFLTDGTFRAAFQDKAPHEALLEDIATLIVTADLPALIGLAALARDPANFAIDMERRTWTA